MEDEAHRGQQEERVARLLASFEASDYRPPMLPVVAVELLELSRSRDVEFPQILALLEKDPLLAARVLKIAQSPLHAGHVQIRSLQQAVVRLGISTLTGIFFEAGLNLTLFKAHGYEEPMDWLRRHSSATAYVSRVVCRYTGIEDEYAFLCGLLHDIGMAAAMISLSNDRALGAGKFAEVGPLIVQVHERASGRLAMLWKLPEGIQRVLGHHHHFEIDGSVDRTAAVVCLAESLASALGAAFESECDAGQLARASAALNVPDSMLEMIRSEAQDLIERLAPPAA